LLPLVDASWSRRAQGRARRVRSGLSRGPGRAVDRSADLKSLADVGGRVWDSVGG